jgi:FkbM family methyltransferase
MIRIDEYRLQVLDVLKQTNNHYTTKLIELNVFNKKIQYHQWQHPLQGNWEMTSLFTDQMLYNLSKIIVPGSTVIDIGAHTGNMSVAYSLFADKVIAFEPNPATYEVLELNSRINTNIHPFNYAISDEEGALTFHYSDNGFCNGGFATRTSAGIGVTGHVIPIDVIAVNFEKFIQDNDIDIGKVSLIKIDAEGHDKDILKTLSHIITQHTPVIITEIYNGLHAHEVIDLLDTIHRLGYKAYDENFNYLNIDQLGNEVCTIKDIIPGSGHNLICIHDTK